MTNRVLMFQPRFAPLVESGQKGRTMRPPRKRPIQVGDTLLLRAWVGKPYGKGSTVRDLLPPTRCRNVTAIEIFPDGFASPNTGFTNSPKSLDYFARLDGFADWQDMVQWFDGEHGLPFTGTLIEWGPL